MNTMKKTTIQEESSNAPRNCLVTGVTGYIGGRLVPSLLEAGHKVRVVCRDAGRLQGRVWVDQVEVVEADVLKPETMAQMMEGIDIRIMMTFTKGTFRPLRISEKKLVNIR
jgi:uncharacterized protein YbjT (DUF2867 family)